MTAEDDRALAWRVSAAHRRAAESARCARLVGSGAAFEALRLATLPLMTIDPAGVPRQALTLQGSTDDGEGQDDRECP